MRKRVSKYAELTPSLNKKLIVTQDNIKDFCKSNQAGTASPNHELRIPYEQKPNRGQVNLIIRYNGDRGQGATYSPNEYTPPDHI